MHRQLLRFLICAVLLLAALPQGQFVALAQGKPGSSSGSGTGVTASPDAGMVGQPVVPNSEGGLAFGFGKNGYGQLGLGYTNFNASAPVGVVRLGGLVALSIGHSHSVALTASGTVWVWGDNSYKQLGNPSYSGTTSPLPVQVSGLSGVIAVVAGGYHSLALKSNGTVWAWGNNDYGQLGADPSSNGYSSAMPVQVSSLSGVVAIAAGNNHSLALTASGTIWAWGYNADGELGDPSLSRNDPHPTARQVVGLTGAIAISGGFNHSLAVKSDGTVYAWGANSSGQLGNTTNAGNSNPNPTPTRVSGVTGAVAVSAGGYHSLALTAAGTVYAWGENSRGQLGNTTNVGNYNSNPTPTLVSGLSGATAIAAGRLHSLALTASGTVYGWGNSYSGEIGRNVFSSDPNPDAQPVPGISGVVAIAAGSEFSMVIRGAGRVRSWGNNNYGQLGDGTTNYNNGVSSVVNNLSGVIQVATGGGFSAALTASGTVWVWGYNGSGALGNGTSDGDPHPTPQQVPGLSNIVAIDAGLQHMLALKIDGTLYAWGQNVYSQSCNNFAGDTLSPQVVLSNVTAFDGATQHSLALTVSGDVYGCGDNEYGEIGPNVNNPPRYSSMTKIAGASGINIVALAGGNHSLGLKSDGTIYSWGNNDSGQLGNGLTGASNGTPTGIANFSNNSAISAGYAHSMALKSDGTVYTWGSDSSGQLGTPGDDQNTPQQVTGLSNINAISAGAFSSLALVSNGTVQEWGYGAGYSPTQHAGLGEVRAISAGNGHNLALQNTASSTSLSSTTPADAGRNVTFTATISSSYALTGTVSFYDGANLLGTRPLTNSSANLMSAAKDSAQAVSAGSSVTFSTSNLSAGTHLISATFSGGGGVRPSTAYLTLVVNSAPANVVWIDAVGVVTSSNTITRTYISQSWGAGAASQQAISSGTGYVQATVSSSSTTAAFGLGNTNSDQTPDDINFAVYLTPQRGVEITENGARVSSFSPPISYSGGDSFRIAIEDNGGANVVRFYKISGNSSTAIYTSTASSLIYPLQLDTAIWNQGSALQNAVIGASSLVNIAPRPTTSATTCNNITWTRVLPAGYASTFGNSIQRNYGPEGWNVGASSVESYTRTTRPISAQITVPRSGTNYIAFGLNDQDQDQGLGDIDFTAVIYPPSRLLNVYYRGNLVKSVGDVAGGDLIRSELTSTQFRVFRNNVPVFVGNLGIVQPTLPYLRFDSSLYYNNSEIDNAQLCTGTTSPAQTNSVAPEAVSMDVSRPKVQNVSFSDVQPGEFYYDAVQYLAGYGIVSGYADGTFRPFVATTRAQLAKMVVLAAGGVLENPTTPTFSDVNSSSPFYQYVETALARRMISGYADGAFRPNASVTRGQLAKVVTLGLFIPLVENSAVHFNDVASNSPFFQYIETAQSLDLLSGYADGSFRSGAAATRGQIAKIVFLASQIQK